MPYLLRVELPDVPGSLGRLASAIGEAGGDIEAIEIVEKRHDEGTAVDDVLLEVDPGVMPDSIVSACTKLDGVAVVWISRYAAGGLMFDLEAVEELTADPARALDRLVDLLPTVFRVDWAARVHRAHGVAHTTGAAPDDHHLRRGRAPAAPRGRGVGQPHDDETLYAAARVDGNEVVVVARRGGPEFLDSELARLGHLAGLAASIAHS